MSKQPEEEVLLERGILAFLREAVADPGAVVILHGRKQHPTISRIASPGYERSGASGPESEGPEPQSR
jgi:hypothetical protein